MSKTNPGKSTPRYYRLDYLRGMMALSIMLFHLDKWLCGHWDASSLLGRLGVYAVSVFFVLSGLTLGLVYAPDWKWDFQHIKHFFWRRFLRIFPLLWLATLGTLVFDEWKRAPLQIFLNLSGFFGWINPGLDIATGAWSIGVELVFYGLFPIVLTLCLRNSRCIGVILGICIIVALFWAFSKFSRDYTEQSQWWSAYVQVINHTFFFFWGLFLALYKDWFGRFSIRLLFACFMAFCLAFCLWPVDPLPYNLVSGWNRVALSCFVLGASAAYWGLPFNLKGIGHKGLYWLGNISYSLYLLHPPVFRGLQAVLRNTSLGWGYWEQFLLTALFSFALAHLVYHGFEKPIFQSSASFSRSHS